MRPSPTEYASDARRRRGQLLAAVLVDMARINPDTLRDESDLFWEAVTALTLARGVKVTAPTRAETDVIDACADAVRAALADRDRVPDEELFDAFTPRVVR